MLQNSLPPLRFNLSELAGSLGDFGTIIPLVLAVALVSDVNARYVLLFFGIWFILTGLYYRLPIPLEPMKAVAVIVIAGSIGSGEIAAAGLILGIIFLVLGYGRFFGIIEQWVPQSVVRGIQLGLALLLFRSSVDFVVKDPTFFLLGIAIIACFYLLARFRSIPDLSAIVVIGVGLIAGIALYGVPPVSLIPAPELVIPLPSDFSSAFATLVLPQVVLTITNAILATSLLTKDLFCQDVPPKKFSTTIGLMNLISVPFGGFPMCHGAGGTCRAVPLRGTDGRGKRVCRPDLHHPCPLLHLAAGALHHRGGGARGPPGLCRYRDGAAQFQDRFSFDYRYYRDPGTGQLDDGCIHRRDGACVWCRMDEEGKMHGKRAEII